jgi:hypothetical protein
MKTKHLAVAVIVLALAVSANVFGDSLTLTGTALPVLGISGATLSFTDSNYEGNWRWGGGGMLTITDASGTLLTDSFASADVVDLSGTSFQVSFGALSSGGSFVLDLYDPALPQVGEAFTSTNEGGALVSGGNAWAIGSGGTVSASGDPVSASEPWNLPMSLVFFGIVAGMFGVLVRARVLRFAHA